MTTRKLGEIEVSSIGLGYIGLSFGLGPATEKSEALKVIRTAVDRGVTLFDTAQAYGPFMNEELVGEALEPVRNRVRICTKFGFKIAGGQITSLDSRRSTFATQSMPPSNVCAQIIIDFLYQHRVDPNVPIDDVAGTVKDLIRIGKVKHFGLSEASALNIRRAHAVQPITAIQDHHSLWMRKPEQTKSSLCEELGVGLVAWGPLGQGFLTGKIGRDSKFDDRTTCEKTSRVSLPKHSKQTLGWWTSSRLCWTKGNHPRTNCSGVAARAKALGRPHPRRHQGRTFG